MTKVNLERKLKKLPKTAGVYLFFDKNGQVIYIGKSTFVAKRVLSYFKLKSLGPKTQKMVKQIEDVAFIKVFSEFEALMLEADLIKKHQPFYNTVAKDDKSPLYIRITGDPIPCVGLTRRPYPQEIDFLKGPFPTSRETRNILRVTRKIFPYCQHKNPRRPCLYVHLGLCPYPQRNEKSRDQYQQAIKKIKKLLSGKTQQLEKQLTREMSDLAKQERFEEAAAAKSQLESLQLLLLTYHLPDEFLRQPTLVDDLTLERLKDLKEKLNLVKLPRRIECYDISSLFGTLAVGSMIVFTNGHPDKGQYRRFKIKLKKAIDDYAMTREILARRFKNDWPEPDLIIIDGGRGHLNSALSILNKHHKKIPVVSLAKKYEEIYLPFKILPLSLPAQTSARQLAGAIRDEAHRFAIGYHRLLRSKHMLSQNLIR